MYSCEDPIMVPTTWRPIWAVASLTPRKLPNCCAYWGWLDGIEGPGARAGLYTCACGCACWMGGGERTGGIGWTGTRSVSASQLARDNTRMVKRRRRRCFVEVLVV